MTVPCDCEINGGLAHWGIGEIDGLLVPQDKASKLLTDHLIITG